MSDVYRHYRGGDYQLLHEAYDEESGNAMVVYRRLKDGKIWVRPLHLFFGYVTVGESIIKRFAKLATTEQKDG